LEDSGAWKKKRAHVSRAVPAPQAIKVCGTLLGNDFYFFRDPHIQTIIGMNGTSN
jgi:hypothetical protein